MGWNPVKEAEKKAKKAVDKIIKPAVKRAENTINGLLNGAKNSINDSLNEAKNSIKWNLNKARNSIKWNLDKAKEDIQDTANEAKNDITKELPELVENVAHKIASEAAKDAIGKVLDVACDTIELFAPTRYTMTFGIELALVVQGEVTVTFTIPNPIAKLTEIRKWAKNPPKGRAQIIECIRDFGPESLTGEFKISGNGLTSEWDGDDKYDKIDAFLSKHGVN